MRATLLSRSRWGWWRGQDLATLARMRRRELCHTPGSPTSASYPTTARISSSRTINRSGSPSCIAGVPND